VLALTALLATPAVARRHGWSRLRSVLRADLPRILLLAALISVSYGLVLTAYTMAPVAYAGAVREVSIVFAALAGWLWLGEAVGRRRTAGSLLLFLGIVLISAAG
jgi:drug/metabolite transporter (DMT)-like permease